MSEAQFIAEVTDEQEQAECGSCRFFHTSHHARINFCNAWEVPIRNQLRCTPCIDKQTKEHGQSARMAYDMAIETEYARSRT